MNQEGESKVHFFNLDILRFIAAFMIMVLHGYNAFASWIHRPAFFTVSNTNYRELNTIGFYFERMNGNLGYGVDFFFIISGFLITYLLLKEKERFRKIHIGKFYLRRILRIWPLYFLIIASTPLWLKFTEMPEPIYGWTLFFANNFQGIKYSGTAMASQFPFMHFWSVCVEEHFYLVWPLLLAITPMKKIPWCLGGVILASVLFRVGAFFFISDYPAHIHLNSLSKMDILSFGGCVAWLYHKKPFVLKIPLVVRMPVYLLGIAMFFFFPPVSAADFWLFNLKTYCFVAFLIFILVNYLFNPSVFFNFKKKNFIHYLGKISYGIYLYHNILFIFIIHYMYRHDVKSLPLFCTSYIIIVFAASALSYELFEKQFLKLKDRFALIKTSR